LTYHEGIVRTKLFYALFAAAILAIAALVLTGSPIPSNSAQPIVINTEKEIQQEPACAQQDRCVCRVSSHDDTPLRPGPGSLRYCVEESQKPVIEIDVSGTILLRETLDLRSNSVLRGRPWTKREDQTVIAAPGIHGLRLRDIENVTIENLIFDNGAGTLAKQQRCSAPTHPRDTLKCGVVIVVQGRARDIWIRNSIFTRCGEKCITLWSHRGRDAAGRATAPDRVWISGNIFENSYFGILAGVHLDLPDEALPSEPGRLVFFHNVFDDIVRRAPRVTNRTQALVYNNWYDGWGGEGPCKRGDFGFALSSVGEARLIAIANVIAARPFEGGCTRAGDRHPVYHKKTRAQLRGLGSIHARDNVFLNGAALEQAQHDGAPFDPAQFSLKGNAPPPIVPAGKLGRDANGFVTIAP